MNKFRCKNCNRVLSFESNLPPKTCPNCGETDSLSKEKSAEELVGEL